MARAAMIVVGAGLALAGCGGDGGGPAPRDTSGGPANGIGKPRPTQAIKSAVSCLRAAGFRASGGPAPRHDPDAPAAEVVAAKGGGYPKGDAVFVAYYPSARRAELLAPMVRHNAERIHATVERYGAVTLLWTRRPTRDVRADVTRCIFK